MSELKRGKVYFLDGEYERALEVFYDAAADGDAEGAFDYAFCHQFGYGTVVDYRTAVSFYKFAAVRVPEANYNLAVIYMMGLGVSRDYRVAYEYMRDAAAAGVVEAQLYLGVALYGNCLYAGYNCRLYDTVSYPHPARSLTNA